MIMEVASYFNRVRKYYQSSFDFTTPFSYQNREYTALAAYHAHVDKYVLVKKAQLWSVNSNEYCLFQTYDDVFSSTDFNDLTHILVDYMEPELVRKGEPVPEKDHMYTYLTIVILCQKEVPKDMIKLVKHYNFTKYYKMYARGYSEAHIILADMACKKVYTNRAGYEMKKLYKRIFKDLEHNKS